MLFDFGRVSFSRPVEECAKCRRQFSVCDEQIGLEPRERLSLGVRQKAARLGSRMDYEAASSDLGYLLGLGVSAKEVQNITREAGRRSLEVLAAQHEQWSRPTRPESPVESEKGHETVVLGIDGTCVMGRDGQGHEVKVATVFGLDEHAVQSKRPLLLSRRYCATSLGIGAFWPMVWALATRWGARSAKRVVVLGDGAHWIWKLARERLPSALCILDFYHASEHLHALARALWGEGSAQALQWASHHSHLLKEQGPGLVFAELHRLRKTLRATKRQRVEHELTYFENNRQRMDYPAYHSAGLPIGSGAVEGACKTLVKERMSGAGQRWSDAGTEQMVALRTILFNEDWDKIWTKRAA